jgi:hypothetical protein
MEPSPGRLHKVALAESGEPGVSVTEPSPAA